MEQANVSNIATVRPKRVRKHAGQCTPAHCAVHGTGATKLNTAERDIVLKALAILDARVRRAPAVITSCAAVKAWLTLHYGLLTREVFGVLLLDSQHRLIAHEQPFSGTIDGTSVYPREVLRCVFEHNAAAVLALHCHPSGVREPSHADRMITTRLRDALAVVDVRLLDHVIVAGDETYSFAEHGLM